MPINRLIQEIPHRWNSTFFMVVRISEQANVNFISLFSIFNINERVKFYHFRRYVHSLLLTEYSRFGHLVLTRNELDH